MGPNIQRLVLAKTGDGTPKSDLGTLIWGLCAVWGPIILGRARAAHCTGFLGAGLDVGLLVACSEAEWDKKFDCGMHLIDTQRRRLRPP